MAFPVVEARQTGSTTTNATTHAITLPGSIAAGELLLAFVSVDGQPIISNNQGRWTKLGGQFRNGTTVTGCVYAKIAETGTADNLTITTTSEMASWVTMRISGHGGLPVAAGTNGSSTNSDPPSLTPPWGAQDYLWIAARMGDANVAATAAPINYSNLTGVAHSDATNGASVHTAERTANGSTEDPGGFTSATEQWAAITVAVPPSTIAFPQLVGSYAVTDRTDSTTSLVSPSFTPVAGEILVVKASASVSGAVASVPTATGLTFTSRGTAGTSGDFCYTRLSTATVPAGAGSITVTQAWTGTAAFRSFVVERWRNAQLDATPVVTATTGATTPNTTLTTEAASSAVSWVSADWTPVAPAAYLYRGIVNETLIFDASTADYVGYYGFQNAATAASQTIGLSAPTGQAWSLVAIEVQYGGASASAATTIAATATANTSSPASVTASTTAAVTAGSGSVVSATSDTTAAVTATAFAMSLGAVGSIASTEGTAQATFTISTTTVGNCVVVATRINSSTKSITGLSGGGCTWASLGTAYVATNRGRTYELWLGTVTSVVSGSTVTATWNSTITTSTINYVAQEFTNGTPSTWALETSQYAGLEVNTTSTTLQYPTLTAAAPARLYFGRGSASAGTPTATGSPTFFVFKPGTDMWCYGLLSSAGSVSPTQTNSSNAATGAVAAIIVPTAIGAAALPATTLATAATGNTISPATASAGITAAVTATAGVFLSATVARTVAGSATANVASATAATPIITAAVAAIATSTGVATPIITAAATATAVRIDTIVDHVTSVALVATAGRTDHASATLTTTARVFPDGEVRRPTSATRLNVRTTMQPALTIRVDLDEFTRLDTRLHVIAGFLLGQELAVAATVAATATANVSTPAAAALAVTAASTATASAASPGYGGGGYGTTPYGS